MPGGDRTGPMGMGPMTGRGAGYCAGFAVPGFTNRMFGGSFGRGWGRGGGGWGRRNVFYATGVPGWARAGVGAVGAGAAPSPVQATTREQELEILKQQAQQAASVLQSVQQRISELEGGAPQ